MWARFSMLLTSSTIQLDPVEWAASQCARDAICLFNTQKKKTVLECPWDHASHHQLFSFSPIQYRPPFPLSFSLVCSNNYTMIFSSWESHPISVLCNLFYNPGKYIQYYTILLKNAQPHHGNPHQPWPTKTELWDIHFCRNEDSWTGIESIDE